MGGLITSEDFFYKNSKMFCLCEVQTDLAQVPTIRNQRCRRFHNIPAGLLEHFNLRQRGREKRSLHKGTMPDRLRDPRLQGKNDLTWRQGRSGFESTSPGPMMLKVASMCMGFGSLNEMMWIL